METPEKQSNNIKNSQNGDEQDEDSEMEDEEEEDEPEPSTSDEENEEKEMKKNEEKIRQMKKNMEIDKDEANEEDSEDEVKNFLSARKRQFALLVIVFFSLLIIKSLIKSNYTKSTPTHSEPPNHTSQKDCNRIPKKF